MEQLVKDEAAIPSEQYHLSGICSGFYNWVEAPILGGGCYLLVLPLGGREGWNLLSCYD